jgi:hypothetical protein
MRRVLLCVLLAACLFPDTSGLGGDASVADGAPGDSLVDAVMGDAPTDALVTCDPSKPFTNIMFVPGISASDAENPRLSGDELELFYQVYGDAGATALVHATRASTLDAFGAPVYLDVLNDLTANTWDAMLSADGVTLVFASDRTTGRDAIYRATRASPTAPFGSPSLVLGVDAPFEQDKPYVQGTNAALWYMSYESGGGDIYVAQSTGTDYGGGVAETELNTPVEEGFPVVNAAGTLIYFYRAETVDAGGLDHLWMAQRASVSVPFNAPTLVTEVNAMGGDIDPGWLSPDLCRLYFTGDKTGSSLPYVASRTP